VDLVPIHMASPLAEFYRPSSREHGERAAPFLRGRERPPRTPTSRTGEVKHAPPDAGSAPRAGQEALGMAPWLSGQAKSTTFLM